MEYRKFSGLDRRVSVLGLGTWAFGNDFWWGKQSDEVSLDVLEKAVENGINLIDTAPIYGRGHSEEVVGRFLKKRGLRDKLVIATKLGLDWTSGKLFNLKRAAMLREIEASRRRLGVEVIDIYQIHWPDPETSIKESAKVMREFYEQGLIKAVGVSNYSVDQMKEFMNYCPLHSLQPPYNMFRREIEEKILPFCVENNISVLSYSPLHGGVLTGKFFFDNVAVPRDMVRKNLDDLKEPKFSVNKKILLELKKIADSYGKSLAEFVLNWTIHAKGITTVLVGARNKKQIQQNFGCLGWGIKEEDIKKIEAILDKRKKLLNL